MASVPSCLPDNGRHPLESGIFVTVGTALDPFDRLLRMLDELLEQGALELPVVAQTGSCTYQPQHFQAIPLLPADDLERRLNAARVIVCHGGAGTLGTCLLLGKRPVVLPRLARYKEVINDHQLELCEELAAQGRIHLAHDQASLHAGVQAVLSAPANPGITQPPTQNGEPLKQAVATILRKLATKS